MEPVQRPIAPPPSQSQTLGAASASLPGFHVVVVLHASRDAAGTHITWCVARVNHVVCAPRRVQLIRTDAGLVIDLPAEAVVELTVHDESLVWRP
jgi:hypothetical protein